MFISDAVVAALIVFTGIALGMFLVLRFPLIFLGIIAALFAGTFSATSDLAYSFYQMSLQLMIFGAFLQMMYQCVRYWKREWFVGLVAGSGLLALLSMFIGLIYPDFWFATPVHYIQLNLMTLTGQIIAQALLLVALLAPAAFGHFLMDNPK